MHGLLGTPLTLMSMCAPLDVSTTSSCVVCVVRNVPVQAAASQAPRLQQANQLVTEAQGCLSLHAAAADSKLISI